MKLQSNYRYRYYFFNNFVVSYYCLILMNFYIGSLSLYLACCFVIHILYWENKL